MATCKNWKAGGACEDECPFRHSEYHCKKNRREEMCYWEDKPSGCTKVKCEYRHVDPSKDAWKSNLPAQNMESIPKSKVCDALDHGSDVPHEYTANTMAFGSASTDTTSLKDYEDMVDGAICTGIQSDMNHINNFSGGNSWECGEEIECQLAAEEKKSISMEKENGEARIRNEHGKFSAKETALIHDSSAIQQTDPTPFHASKIPTDKCMSKHQLEDGHSVNKSPKKNKASNIDTSDASSKTTVILEELDKDIEELDNILAGQ